METLQQLPGVVNVQRSNGQYQVEAETDLRSQAASAVIQSGGKLLKLGVETHSLDDIYARYFEEVEHGSRISLAT
jgi:ABC-2 type transport system ATP-binding protein